MTASRTLSAGVPQGSPLSLILFLLRIASLYEALEAVEALVVVGFADDANFISGNRDIAANAQRLELAWTICVRWAQTRGMVFAPKRANSCT